jgi:tryptophan synthase alpha chain
MVSSASTTGEQKSFGEKQETYFKRIADMKLKTPLIVGFGISNKQTFQFATKQTKGAIIGSEFVKFLNENSIENIATFMQRILE